MCKKLILSLILIVSCSTISMAQLNVVKLSAVNPTNPQTPNPLDIVGGSSFAFSYEHAYGDHWTVELLGIYARSISFEDELVGRVQTVPLQGAGLEAKWRYYFMTNSNFITYAPYGFYAAPTFNYTFLEGKSNTVDRDNHTVPALDASGQQITDLNGNPVNDIIPVVIGSVTHKISYMAIGGMAGYQFIMEEFEQGVVFDIGLGFNYLITKEFKKSSINHSEISPASNGYFETDGKNELKSFIPKIHISIGYTF